MIFSLGVVAYVAWRASSLWLLVGAPFVWVLGRYRLLVVHLALVMCHAAIFLAVRMQTWVPPGDDHDLYVTMARRYSDFPVALVDVIVLFGRTYGIDRRFLLVNVLVATCTSIASFAMASWITPIWLKTIPPTILTHARSAAKDRAFCLNVGLNGRVERLDRLDFRDLYNAFEGSIEYSGYYALMNIEGDAIDYNWSFRKNGFVAASPSFRASCEPVTGGQLQ